MEKSLLEANSKVDMPLATFAFQEWAKELLAQAEFLQSHVDVCILLYTVGKSHVNVCILHCGEKSDQCLYPTHAENC